MASETQIFMSLLFYFSELTVISTSLIERDLQLSGQADFYDSFRKMKHISSSPTHGLLNSDSQAHKKTKLKLLQTENAYELSLELQ